MAVLDIIAYMNYTQNQLCDICHGIESAKRSNKDKVGLSSKKCRILLRIDSKRLETRLEYYVTPSRPKKFHTKSPIGRGRSSLSVKL